ncbi:hypothetical protein HDU83_004849 [Entophlyctis luteolus]|nr:hypothetical protein HDU83_004849 [Entophlyctis luteolus]
MSSEPKSNPETPHVSANASPSSRNNPSEVRQPASLNDKEVVKVSTLGSAGLMSLVNRKIDGEDLVRMTRRMKGTIRNEFIGYIEILGQNSQIVCNCGNPLTMRTSPDGMKSFVGTECEGPSPCTFVIGKLSVQTIAATETPAQRNLESATSQRPKSIVGKPKKERHIYETVHRPSTALFTKTGLYVTMPDADIRGIVADRKAKPRQKAVSKPTKGKTPKLSTLTPISGQSNGLDSDSVSRSSILDPVIESMFGNFQSKMSELGVTSVDQLLNSDGGLSNQSTELLDVESLFNFDAFFYSQPDMVLDQGRDLIPSNSCEAGTQNLCFQARPTSSFSNLSGNLSHPSRRNSTFDATEIFPMDSLNSDVLLNSMMTNCDLESLDGSTASGMQVDPFFDDLSIPRYVSGIIPSQQTFLHSWIPRPPFSDAILSSSPSSVSSRTTIGSSFSNLSASKPSAPSVAAAVSKRKRAIGQTLLHEKPVDLKKTTQASSTNKLRSAPKPSTGPSTSSLASRKSGVGVVSAGNSSPAGTGTRSPAPATSRRAPIPANAPTLPRPRAVPTATARVGLPRSSKNPPTHAFGATVSVLSMLPQAAAPSSDRATAFSRGGTLGTARGGGTVASRVSLGVSSAMSSSSTAQTLQVPSALGNPSSRVLPENTQISDAISVSCDTALAAVPWDGAGVPGTNPVCQSHQVETVSADALQMDDVLFDKMMDSNGKSDGEKVSVADFGVSDFDSFFNFSMDLDTNQGETAVALVAESGVSVEESSALEDWLL